MRTASRAGNKTMGEKLCGWRLCLCVSGSQMGEKGHRSPPRRARRKACLLSLVIWPCFHGPLQGCGDLPLVFFLGPHYKVSFSSCSCGIQSRGFPENSSTCAPVIIYRYCGSMTAPWRPIFSIVCNLLNVEGFSTAMQSQNHIGVRAPGTTVKLIGGALVVSLHATGAFIPGYFSHKNVIHKPCLWCVLHWLTRENIASTTMSLHFLLLNFVHTFVKSAQDCRWTL